MIFSHGTKCNYNFLGNLSLNGDCLKVFPLCRVPGQNARSLTVRIKLIQGTQLLYILCKDYNKFGLAVPHTGLDWHILYKSTKMFVL